jgi:hypothetical protein
MRTIRHENVALLTMAAVFSVVATVVLSGFLEPSQPPAVAAVEIGDPRESQSRAREREERPRRDAGERRRAERQEAAPPQEARPAPQPEAAPQAKPAPLLPIAPAESDDDAGEPAEADDDED